MEQGSNIVILYGQSHGWDLRSRTVLVEGTTDEALFQLAARLELEKTGVDLLADELAIIAAGEGEQGGTPGVIRELNTLRSLARASLMPNGLPRYRFIGLFDNDYAGKKAIRDARSIDTSILEYKDVFRLHPVMPRNGNLDPKTLGKTFERLNKDHTGLNWELEDLLPTNFIDAFLDDHPDIDCKENEAYGKIHRDFNWDGKALLHQYIKKHAIREDLVAVCDVIQALRFYLRLPRLIHP